MVGSGGVFMTSPCYQEVNGGLLLAVRVQPRSSRAHVGEVIEGRLRIRLTAPPVDDAANAALLVTLACWLGVGRGDVVLVAGLRSREKRVLVRGEAAALRRRLEALLQG
jgi:hypothetical protein